MAMQQVAKASYPVKHHLKVKQNITQKLFTMVLKKMVGIIDNNMGICTTCE